MSELRSMTSSRYAARLCRWWTVTAISFTAWAWAGIRMRHKVTLKAMVTAKVEAVLDQRPKVRVIKNRRRDEGQLDIPHRCVVRGRRAHRLLLRSRAAQGRGRRRLRAQLSRPPPCSSKSTVNCCGMSPTGLSASFGRWSSCARGIRVRIGTELHRCSATSAAVATAWATPIPRSRDCPSPFRSIQGFQVDHAFTYRAYAVLSIVDKL